MTKREVVSCKYASSYPLVGVEDVASMGVGADVQAALADDAGLLL